MIQRRIAPVSLLAAAIVAAPGALAELTPQQWRTDLDFLVRTVEEVHPNPFGRISAERFHDAARELRGELPELDSTRTTARLMELAASIADGHSHLDPAGPNGFRHWFPLRFRYFPDGLFVVASDAAEERLVGAQVLRIGGVDAGDALARVAKMVAGDNDLWRFVNAPFYLSSGEALVAQGVLESPDRVDLVVAPRGGGEPIEVTLTANEAPFDTGWYWRVLGTPPGTTAKRPFEYEAPLHLRQQAPGGAVYWYEYLEGSKTLYYQLNAWWNAGEETFAAFNRRMWAFYDSHPVERLVFDLRYNAGGDGTMFEPLLREMIRRPELEQPGHLLVVVGPRTFSASLLALGQMLRHTNATVIGEPPGAGLNMYGDAGAFRLPESGMELHVSTLFWQAGFPADRRTVVSPHLPVLLTSDDFFAGQDPALELAESGQALKLTDRFLRDGGAVAVETYARQRAAYRDLGWWEPFAERELNGRAYDLLAADRLDDALAAFRLNAETFPDSSNVWDSLGEALLKKRRLPEAADAYRRAFELDPGNERARSIVERIDARLAELAGTGFRHPPDCPVDCGAMHALTAGSDVACPVCGMHFVSVSSKDGE